MSKDFQRKIAGLINEAQLDPFKSLGDVKGITNIYKHNSNTYSFEYKGNDYFMLFMNRDELYICKKLDFVNFDGEWDGADQTPEYIKAVLDGKIP